MSTLQFSARYKIYPGNLDEFKMLAGECLSIVKEKDKDTLQYDWYFNQDQTEWVLREIFPDSDAFLTHIKNIGDLAGKIMLLGEMMAEIYGEPSEELLKALKGLDLKVYSFYRGL
jgi:quinol monooxygenase YgiN